MTCEFRFQHITSRVANAAITSAIAANPRPCGQIARLHTYLLTGVGHLGHDLPMNMASMTDAELLDALETNMLIDRELATPADDARLLALRAEAAARHA